MAKKPRENRIPIMMSDDELASVDNWRYDNRVATRSDAVRRLCRTALALDGRLDSINKSLKEFSVSLHETAGICEEITTQIKDVKIGEQLAYNVINTTLQFVVLQTELRNVISQALNFKNNVKDIDALLEDSNKIDSELTDMIRRIGASAEEISEIKSISQEPDEE